MKMESTKLQNLNKAAAGVAGGLTGFFTVLNTAAPGVTGVTNQVEVIVAGIVGPGNAAAVFKAPVPATGPKPTGIGRWLNAPVIAGAGLLIADQVITAFIDGKHGYKYARPWFLALGAGFIGGGLLGAALDPDTGGRAGGSVGVGAGYVSGFAGSRAGGVASRVQGFGGTYSS